MYILKGLHVLYMFLLEKNLTIEFLLCPVLDELFLIWDSNSHPVEFLSLVVSPENTKARQHSWTVWHFNLTYGV